MTLFDPPPPPCPHGRMPGERCPACAAAGLEAGRAARDEGMARADDHAPPEWKVHAAAAIDARISSGAEFMADDVWADLDAAGVPKPPERRALGPLIVQASKRGRIVRVGYRQSTRPEAHANPKAVWVAR